MQRTRAGGKLASGIGASGRTLRLPLVDPLLEPQFSAGGQHDRCAARRFIGDEGELLLRLRAPVVIGSAELLRSDADEQPGQGELHRNLESARLTHVQSFHPGTAHRATIHRVTISLGQARLAAAIAAGLRHRRPLSISPERAECPRRDLPIHCRFPSPVIFSAGHYFLSSVCSDCRCDC
ncbi:MAG TPA: hypothetical protein VHY20_01720 [Pirellulales bacterium]|nr:hypothetical protein [Pirellulales bacterium]